MDLNTIAQPVDAVRKAVSEMSTGDTLPWYPSSCRSPEAALTPVAGGLARTRRRALQVPLTLTGEHAQEGAASAGKEPQHKVRESLARAGLLGTGSPCAWCAN